MSDMRELYQEVILDHGKRPRNFRKPKDADRMAEGNNPLCGDKLRLYVRLRGEVIEEIGFQGAGCAIFTASASMMTEYLKGKTRQDAEALFNDFHDMVTGQEGVENGGLGKLMAFSTVCEYPTRVKCATLAWHTLRAALKGGEERVTTE